MPKYKKKPVVIEAWRASDLLKLAMHAWNDLPLPVLKAYEAEKLAFSHSSVIVETNHGEAVAEFTDWVILSPKGELYPCRPDEFISNYELAEPY